MKRNPSYAQYSFWASRNVYAALTTVTGFLCVPLRVWLALRLSRAGNAV
jgi:hypothetical protein